MTSEDYRRIKHLHITPEVLVMLLSQDGTHLLKMKGMPADAKIVDAMMTNNGCGTHIVLAAHSMEFPVRADGQAFETFDVVIHGTPMVCYRCLRIWEENHPDDAAAKADLPDRPIVVG